MTIKRVQESAALLQGGVDLGIEGAPPSGEFSLHTGGLATIADLDAETLEAIEKGIVQISCGMLDQLRNDFVSGQKEGWQEEE